MKLQALILVPMLLLGGLVRAHPAPAKPPAALPAGHGWIAEEDDNICGITDLKKVTNPAAVDYEDLLAATPQIREMRRKRIDPQSPEGKALRTGAQALITKSSELVRRARGHCSVWKVIRHKDGRAIADVTESVRGRF